MTIKQMFRRLARRKSRSDSDKTVEYADPASLGKAEKFVERFREIVSDPLNLLISRIPEAGYVDAEGFVILHNGNRAHFTGPFAYYSEFSDILVINRGVHEPLEEYCFQQTLLRIKDPAPIMLELGAYWAHYSMWLKGLFPEARCIMVEPEPHNADSGRRNFAANGYSGEFIVDLVGETRFRVDTFLAEATIPRIDILHCDIQGAELEMLEGADHTLAAHAATYVFISTHSDALHTAVVERLTAHGYRIEATADFGHETTSYDGFVLASAPSVSPVLGTPRSPGRLEIAKASPRQLVDAISAIAGA